MAVLRGAGCTVFLMQRTVDESFRRMLFAGCMLAEMAAVNAEDQLIVPDSTAPPGESLLLPMRIAVSIESFASVDRAAHSRRFMRPSVRRE